MGTLDLNASRHDGVCGKLYTFSLYRESIKFDTTSVGIFKVFSLRGLRATRSYSLLACYSVLQVRDFFSCAALGSTSIVIGYLCTY